MVIRSSMSRYTFRKLLCVLSLIGFISFYLVFVMNKYELVMNANRQFFAVTDNISLSNGVEMPIIGFGTAGLQDPYKAIRSAFDAGYVLFDTASDTGPWYKTEKIIGDIMKEKGIRRENVFITTKLHPQDFGNVEESFKNSLKNLRTNYIDLYLLHYPRCWGNLCSNNIHFLSAWEKLEELYENKKVRAIGISNFDIDDIKLIVKEAKIKPHVIQIRFDPFSQPWNKVRLAKIYGIAVQSYSPLGTQWEMKYHTNPVLNNTVLKSIANRYNKTIPQVVLKWLIQENVMVIPKSKNPSHIKENLNLFDFTLSTEDIRRIRKLDKTI